MSKAINFCHGTMIGRYGNMERNYCNWQVILHTVPGIQYTLNLRIKLKTEPVMDGAEYHILYCTVYMHTNNKIQEFY